MLAAAAILAGLVAAVPEADAANPFTLHFRRPESMPPGPDTPPPPVHSAYFTFHLCNKSKYDVALVISRMVSAEDTRFQVSGWYVVDRGECSDFGPYPKGWFYFYGERHNASSPYWGANDLKLCVAYPGPFERVNVGGYKCKKKEKLKGFIGRLVADDQDVYSFNLN